MATITVLWGLLLKDQTYISGYPSEVAVQSHEAGLCRVGAGTQLMRNLNDINDFYDDYNLHPCTFIAVNTRLIFKYTHARSNKPLRGLVISHMDQSNISSCQFSEAKVFDTHGSQKEAQQLDSYLRSLKNGTVVIGTSISDFSVALEPAINTLMKLGLPVECIHFGGSIVFVIVIGQDVRYNFFRGYISNGAKPFCSSHPKMWISCSLDSGYLSGKHVLHVINSYKNIYCKHRLL